MSQPVSNSPAPVESGELSKEDIIDLLAPTQEEAEAAQQAADQEREGASRQKPPVDKEKEDEEEVDEEKDKEDKEDDEEEEEKIPDEEELNLVTPVRRKEILAKYPNVFKDFPYLEQAYYREQHFTEIFPTLDDAKEAHLKASNLDSFESDLMQGSFSKVLGAVKASDPEAFNKIADGYLQQLGAVDKDAVHHVIGNVLRNSIINVINEAVRMGEPGDPLKEAAILFHQAIFGTNQIQAPKNLAKQTVDDPEKENLKRERANFIKERFEVSRDNLNTKVQNSVKSTIANHIDPKNSMSDYVRKNAIRDAQEDLESLMSQDNRFSNLMDKLWERAFNENFSPKSLDSIRSTYLSKAKTLLPSVIQKRRNEALKTSRNPREEKDRKGPLPIGGHTTTSTQPRTTSAKASEIPKGMKTLDFLNQD